MRKIIVNANGGFFATPSKPIKRYDSEKKDVTSEQVASLIEENKIMPEEEVSTSVKEEVDNEAVVDIVPKNTIEEDEAEEKEEEKEEVVIETEEDAEENNEDGEQV